MRSTVTRAAVLAAAAAAALLAASVAGAGTGARYADPAKDAGSPFAADITAVAVTTVGNAFRFRIAFANRRHTANTSFLGEHYYVLVDVDGNARTGLGRAAARYLRGADYVLQIAALPGSAPTFDVFRLPSEERVPVHAKVVCCAPWSITIPKSALGSPRAFRFAVLTDFTYRGDPQTIGDRAPDRGSYRWPRATG